MVKSERRDRGKLSHPESPTRELKRSTTAVILRLN